MKLHKKTRQILAMVLVFAILCTMVPDTLITHVQAEQTQNQTHWYQASAKINASWGGHISGEITIKNISDQTRKGWQITLLWSNVAITSMWNGSCDQTDGTYLIRPTEYNQDLEAGASASIGFIAEGEDSLLNRLQSDTFFQETRASITTAEEREADYKTEITQAPAAESTEEPAGEPTNTPAPAEVSAPAPTAELEVPSIADPEPTIVPTMAPAAESTPEPTEQPATVPTAVPTPEATANPTTQPTEEPAEDLYIYTDTTISQDIICRNLFLMGGQLRTGGHTITIQKQYFQNAGSCILQDTTITIGENARINAGTLKAEEQSSLQIGGNLLIDQAEEISLRDSTIQIQGDLCCATKTRFKQYSGSLRVDGNLTVSSGTFAQDDGVKTTIGGDVQITETGNLDLVGYGYGLQMNIGGDLLIQSSQQTILGEGKIAIRGNLIQTPQAAPDSLNTEDGFTLQFCGTVPQEISLAYPETSTLGTMDFRETPGIEVPDILRGRQIYDIAKIGKKASLQLELHDMELIQDETIPCAEVECTKTSIQGTGCSLTVRGNLTLRQGGAIRLNQASLTVENLTLDGIQSLESRQETITVQGDLHCATQTRFKQYSGSLRVDGNLTVSSGTFAQDDGVKTTIGGDVRVTETGNLNLVGYDYGLQMNIGGDLLIQSSQQTILGEGKIAIRGNLIQTPQAAPDSLNTEDGFTLQFCGTAPQEISLAYPETSTLGTMDFRETLGIEVPDILRGRQIYDIAKIREKASLQLELHDMELVQDETIPCAEVECTKTSIQGTGCSLTVRGNLTLRQGGAIRLNQASLTVENLTLDGIQCLESQKETIIVQGDLHCAATNRFKQYSGSLRVDGNLTVSGGTFAQDDDVKTTIGGDVRVTETGSLNLVGYGYGLQMKIGGNLLIQSSQQSSLCEGEIWIKGDVLQTEDDETENLRFDKGITLVLNGTATQTVDLPGITEIPNLDLTQSTSVLLKDDYEGSHLYGLEKLVSKGNTLYSYYEYNTLTSDTTLDTDFNCGGELDLDNHNLTVKGNFRQKGATHVGTGTLRVTGKYTAAKGPLHINEGTVHVDGDMAVQSDAAVYFNGEKSYLCVDGDFTTASKTGSDNRFTTGTMEIKGNLTERKSACKDSLNMTGTKLILSGDKKQTITLQNMADDIYLYDIDMRKSAGVGFASAGIKAGEITGLENITNELLTIRDSHITLQNDEYFKGELILDNTYLNCDGYTLRVGKSFTQTDTILNLNTGTLQVDQDYCILGSSILQMRNQSDLVQVSGSFATASTMNHSPVLHGGRMEIGGDFDQAGNAASFASSENFVIAFLGSGIHKVHFTDSDYSGFANVDPDHDNIEIVTDTISAGTAAVYIAKGFIEGLGEALLDPQLMVISGAFMAAYGLGAALTPASFMTVVVELASLITMFVSVYMMYETWEDMGEVLDSDLSPKEKAEEFGRCGLLLLLSGMSLAGSLTMLSNPQMVRSSLETTKEMLRAKVTEIKQMARILTITNIESLIAYCEGCATEEAMVYLQEVAMEKNVHQLHQLANIVRKAYKEVGTVLQKDDLVAAVRNWIANGSVSKAVSAAVQWAKFRSEEYAGKAFREVVDAILEHFGITQEEFNHLRLKKVSALSDSEKDLIKGIREAVPKLDENTYLQKTIPIEDISKYLGEDGYSTIKGYIANYNDVSHISGYENVVESLRLDYKMNGVRPYPENGNAYGYIKFKTKSVNDIEIPFGELMGGSNMDGYPCTLNGFTGARNGEMIPEWCIKSSAELKPIDGSELYQVIDGKDTLVAKYLNGHFVTKWN